MSRSPIGSLVLVSVLWVASLATAAPLETQNGDTVRVSLGGQARKGVGLRAAGDGWQLRLRAAANGRAEIIDVTPGTPARTLSVTVNGAELRFDPVRFAGGHVYLVQLRKAGAVQSAFVYLYPTPPAKEPRRKETQHVKFTGDELPETDELQPMEKSAL